MILRTGLLPHRIPYRTLSTAAVQTSPPPLVGSAPLLHRHLIIHSSSHPASSWPSHLDSVSPLYRHLNQRWNKPPYANQLSFAFSQVGQGAGATRQEGVGQVPWDNTKNRFDPPPELEKEEQYSATLYPDFLHIPSFSISSLPSFEQQYLNLPSPSSTLLPSATSPRIRIYICTHGARDCRCGDLGEPLYQALVKEIQRRKLGGEMREGEGGGGGQVQVSRVCHIGGHKWAGNALVYKEGGNHDWLGLLRADDARQLLDYALSPTNDTWWSRWRGRVGLTSDQAKETWLEGTGAENGKKKRREQSRNALGDPVKLVFRTWEGEMKEVNGFEGETVMNTAQRHDLPSILGTCGGHCECATCHVHIRPATTTTSAATRTEGGRALAIPTLPVGLPEMTDEEDEQLEFAMGADDDSRLGCQLPVTKELGEWCERGGFISLPRY